MHGPPNARPLDAGSILHFDHDASSRSARPDSADVNESGNILRPNSTGCSNLDVRQPARIHKVVDGALSDAQVACDFGNGKEMIIWQVQDST